MRASARTPPSAAGRRSGGLSASASELPNVSVLARLPVGLLPLPGLCLTRLLLARVLLLLLTGHGLLGVLLLLIGHGVGLLMAKQYRFSHQWNAVPGAGG